MSASPELYTIGQVARRIGVPARTIRFWCDAGILPPTDRSAGGYRQFDAAAVARLDLDRTLRELGLGLDDIRQALHGGTTVAELARVHAAALDAQIRVLRLRRAVLRAVAARGSDLEEGVRSPHTPRPGGAASSRPKSAFQYSRSAAPSVASKTEDKAAR